MGKYLKISTKWNSASKDQKEELLHIYSDANTLDEEAKIDRVKSLYNELVVQEYALQLMDAYNVLGISHLQAIKAHTEGRELAASGQLQRKGNTWSLDAITSVQEGQQSNK